MAKNKIYRPKAVHKPQGKYNHAVEAREGARWLHVAGQVGIAPSGKLARGFKAQCDRAFRNLKGVLKEADMDVGNIVKTTVFLTRAEDIPAYREVREKHMGRNRPASTLLVISALATPDMLFEVEAVAAKS